MEDVNKRLCELLGCEPYETYSRLTGMFIENYPDFADPSGRIELLRRMENHPNGKLFFAQLTYAGENVEAIDDDGLIARSYITDDTGALARVVLEFLEGRVEK